MQITNATLAKLDLMQHRLKAWAKDADKSQQDIAIKLDCNPSLVSRWMNGSNPSHRHMDALGGLFGVDPRHLLFDPDCSWFLSWLEKRQPQDRQKARALLKQAGEEIGRDWSGGFTRETIISVARELSDHGILPQNDDNDTIALALLDLCEQHARNLTRGQSPLEQLTQNKA